jgi:hypothetical protein
VEKERKERKREKGVRVEERTQRSRRKEVETRKEHDVITAASKSECCGIDGCCWL